MSFMVPRSCIHCYSTIEYRQYTVPRKDITCFSCINKPTSIFSYDMDALIEVHVEENEVASLKLHYAWDHSCSTNKLGALIKLYRHKLVQIIDDSTMKIFNASDTELWIQQSHNNMLLGFLWILNFVLSDEIIDAKNMINDVCIPMIGCDITGIILNYMGNDIILMPELTVERLVSIGNSMSIFPSKYLDEFIKFLNILKYQKTGWWVFQICSLISNVSYGYEINSLGIARFFKTNEYVDQSFV